MKKVLSILLALVMLTSSMSNILVFAADISTVSKITAENTYSFPGGTVDVEVTLSNNPGIYNLLMSFEYDSSAMNLIAVSNGTAMSDVTSFTPPKNMASGCSASWYYIDEPVTYKDGSLVVLTFEVLETAEAGESYSVSVTNVTAEDVDGTECDISVENGKVSIIDYIPGDVNGDGRHTIRKDVSEFNQYIVDGCKYDPLGYAVQINENAGDVNDDNKINIRDVIQINKYIVDGCTYDPNGYAVKLLPHTPRCQHTSLTAVPAKEASCTVNGNIAYWDCDNCDKVFSDAEGKAEINIEDTVIEAAHTPGDEATCIEAQTCTKCGDVLKAANGHTEVAVPGYAATTEKEGLTDGSKCSVCDEWIIKQDTIPVLSPEKYTLTYYNNGSYNTEEYIKNEILLLSAPESIVGYDFNGWFTKPDGDGEKIELILSGNPDNIQVVYADYTPIEYQITFTNANGYKEEGIEYTIESKDIYLTTNPYWKHLVFMGWNDESGKLQYVNDTPVIKSGTTGDIVLDATWKTMQNMFETPEKQYSNAAFNPDDGMYYFFYHLGDVKNVLLQPKTETGYSHSGNIHTLTTSKTVTVSNSTAKEEASAVSNALRASFENTFESSVTTELSTTIGASATAGAEVDAGFAKANASATTSTEITAGASWSATIGGSYSEEGETSHTKEFSSTVSYMEESSITQSISQTLDSTDPNGLYYLIPAGTFEIYSVVLYDPVSKELKFDVFSKHIDTYPFVFYEPFQVEVKVNPEIAGIDYDYFADSIKEKVNNSLFVFYESGHEDVIIDEKNNIVSGNYNISSENKLPSCDWYSRDGYVFDGWQVCDNDGNILLEKIEDGAAISELAECCSKENKVFKLSAIWAKKVVVELDQTNVENTNEITSVIYIVPDREKIYKDIECTEEITVDDLVVPERTGYTFCSYHKENVEYISNEKIDSAIYLLTSGDKLLIKWNPNTYTVSFDVNGGDCEVPASIDVKYDSQYGELPILAWNGHKFVGWYLDDSEITKSSYVKTSNSHTLKAGWDFESYTATWTVPAGVNITVKRTSSPNANASIGTLSSGATVFYGDVLSIAYSASAGYSISSKGATSITVTENVTANDIFAVPTVNSYTASWNTPANATIAVKRTSSPYANASIGTLSSGSKVYYGDVLTVTYTAATNYSISNKGETSITVTGNVTKDNIWATAQGNPVTVKFNLNTTSNQSDLYKCYSSVSPSNISDRTVYYGSKYNKDGSLPTPTAFGYSFDGWWTSENGGSQITGDTIVKLTGNQELFAHWTKTKSGYTYVKTPTDFGKIGTSGNYYIVADITLSGTWTPISSFSNGTIDGGNHTISNLTSNATGITTAKSYGFIVTLNGSATVKDIKFNNVTLTADYSGYDCDKDVAMGCVAAINRGIISNVHISGATIKIDSVGSTSGNNAKRHYANVGGICGYNYGTINGKCTVNDVKIYAHSRISKGVGYAYAGGVAGCHRAGTIANVTVSNYNVQSFVRSADGQSAGKLVSGAGGIVGAWMDGASLTSTTLSGSQYILADYDGDAYPRTRYYYGSYGPDKVSGSWTYGYKGSGFDY